MRLGVISWEPGDGLAREAAKSFRQLGHVTVDIWFEDILPEGLDAVFSYGPFGSLVPLANQLVAIPQDDRPALIFWLTEQLPNPLLPKSLVALAGRARSRLERYAYRQNDAGLWRLRPGWASLTRKANRFRYCGDLLWMQEAGILTLLVLGSPFNNAYLNALGLHTYRPPQSFRGEMGADLNLPRDVAVLWLGKTATRRRRRNLERVRSDLAARGIDTLVVDGVENPYIFGEARTDLLNRTCIVLNLLRTPWDSHAQRFQLAALNRALVVSEPCVQHTDFLPGEHFVVAPVEKLAETVEYYLRHEEERQQITDRAYQLVRQTPRITVYARLLEEASRNKEAFRRQNQTAPQPEERNTR
jgi:hypothetical protein